MILSDWEILELQDEHQVISPFEEESLQPATYDLHLDDKFISSLGSGRRSEDGLVLMPHTFLLASTVEKLRIPKNIAAQVKGKSSIARLGILVECAGFVDPGFGLDSGAGSNITLEIKELAGREARLTPGMPICQIQFFRLKGDCISGYSGHYRGENGCGPVPSRYEDAVRVGFRKSSDQVSRWHEWFKKNGGAS